MLRRTASLLALALAALAILATPALARTIDVTTTADGGAGSLRDGLAAAISGDVVHVPVGTYLLSRGVLTVPAGVTVSGDGARGTIVSGGGVSGVLSTGGAGVTIQDLTVTAGRASNGAGIFSNAGLTLHRVAVVGNIASSVGGGVENTGAQPLLIDHSLIANNQATAGPSGGIEAGGSSTGTAIVATTIAGNSSVNAAGGIYVDGIRVLLDGDTLVGNSSAGGQGGNFRVHNSTVTMRDTILAAGNAASGNNCYLSAGSFVVSLGHNAQDTDVNPDSDCQNGLNDPTDRARLVLQLSALQNNGGPTDTMLPAAGSPLVDTGDTANCSATDQRGVPRPQGSACDVGAVERTTPTTGAAFADGITPTSATLHATANTIGLGGSARFAYGPTTGYGAFTAALGLPVTTGAQGEAAQLTGLQPSTTYHFQLLVTTPDGSVAAADQAFTTASVSRPPPAAKCRVPKLIGLTLSRASRALRGAHCKLGTVKRPRARRGHRASRGLVVRRQSLRAGSLRQAGTKVGVTLGPKPARKHATSHRRH
ncbi:MAG TPA: right-handed parallel beta-helix repeat-containing protein [Conexibacter sp.]|jgi:hypothetical protein|nr:right-handed parallel beta-helix repeat-containing protein [Conexibacter sp.]